MTQKRLKEWIEKMGGRDKAAAHFRVNQSTVWRWVRNPKLVTTITEMAIEASLRSLEKIK